MSNDLSSALSIVAPLYNLLFVFITILLFIFLFRVPNITQKIFILPWQFIFASILVYVVEQIMTVLRQENIVIIPIHVNGFFELISISLFLFGIFLQFEHVQSLPKRKRN